MAQMPAFETIETPKAPVSSIYHGVTVTEDYRWLEDAASEQTRAWTMAQDRRSRSYLENLPFYGAVRRRAGEVLKAESVTFGALRRAGSAYFALKDQAPKQQPFLVVLNGLDDLSDERVLVDPNEIDDSGSTTIDWYQPSPDGSLVACPFRGVRRVRAPTQGRVVLEPLVQVEHDRALCPMRLIVVM